MNKVSLNVILAIILVVSALALVNSQYRARHAFMDLEKEQNIMRQLENERQEMEVKFSTFSHHSRVENIARKDLGMVNVTPATTVFLKRGRSEAFDR